MRGLAILIISALLGTTAAQAADVDAGEAIYAQRCQLCHGEEGDGLGPGAERLNPPPRDFTLGQYKFKTTAFDDDIPNDSDLTRMIRDGMPGSAMPGWSDVLSEDDIADLVAYIKTFAGLEEEEASVQLDYGNQIASSPESIVKGRELFHDGERCAECHGADGKGDAVKKLKDDNGERTWPRNLTKPWTFRASNDPRDIFTRVSVGIPTTQMPSFADPKSKKVLTIEERWHVANYVASLAKVDETVRPENTVVKVDKAAGEVPRTIDDPAWALAAPSTFFLVPQIIAKERHFTPSNDTITVRALYDDRDIALLLEWDDRTKSIPGDAVAEKIAEPDMAEDAVAVQFPLDIPEAMEKPYFAMGDATHPVNLWHWRGGTTEAPEAVALFNGRGARDLEKRDAGAAGLSAQGTYANGTWRVLMRRPLATADTGADLQFENGRFIPIAFSVWDGSNDESGSKHTLTTWYWLLLAPPSGSRPIVSALIVMALLLGGELWWARSAAAGRREETS